MNDFEEKIETVEGKQDNELKREAKNLNEKSHKPNIILRILKEFAILILSFLFTFVCFLVLTERNLEGVVDLSMKVSFLIYVIIFIAKHSEKKPIGKFFGILFKIVNYLILMIFIAFGLCCLTFIMADF